MCLERESVIRTITCVLRPGSKPASYFLAMSEFAICEREGAIYARLRRILDIPPDQDLFPRPFGE